MPNIENILKKILIELGLVEARHPELLEKFEILISKLFIALLIEEHFTQQEAEMLLLNFELSKKNDTDYAEYLDTILPLTVIDYYLYIASVTVLKAYIEYLFEKDLITKEKILELIS